MPDILIITSDKSLQNFLKKTFEEHGYSTLVKKEGIPGLETIDKRSPKLILMDDSTSDIVPEDLCSQIKKEYENIPLIVILEDLSYEKFIKRFKKNIDDFITKPISIDKLMARVKMHLNPESQESGIIRVNGITIDTDKKLVKKGKVKIELTPTEYKLLLFLIKNRGKVLSREVILSRVWSYNTDIETRVVDVNIGYLRKKLEGKNGKELIKTVRGFGYLLKE